MIRVLAVGALAALVLGAGLPGPGGKVEWIGAAPNMRDTDGQPPTLVPAFRAGDKMAVWVWPRKGMADAREKTFGTAWDAVGPHDLIALFRHPLADKPPHENTGIPCETYVVRCDWRGKGTVVAGPVHGDPEAVVWIPSRHCGIVAITDFTGVYRSGDPLNAIEGGGMSCNLYLLREGGGFRKLGRSDGVSLLADAGDGRHVFAIEQIIRKDASRVGGYDQRGWLTSIDIATGQRRELLEGPDGGFLSVRDKHAYVVLPHPRIGETTTNPGSVLGPNGEDVTAPVLKVSLDGHREVFLSADPPRAVTSLVISDRGAFSIVCPRSKDGYFMYEHRITVGCGSSSPTSWTVSHPYANWPVPCAGFLPDGSLVTADFPNEGGSGHVSIYQGQPPNPTQLLRTDDPLATHAPFDMSVTMVGKVKVRYVGRISPGSLRPWMIVSARQAGAGYEHAEDRPPGAPTSGALVYPMQVGGQSYLYINGLTSPAGGGTASGGDWNAAKVSVMAFEPVGGVDSLKANLRW